MTISRHYVLAAGGTGGHMMPAFALGAELLRRGHRVALVTDERGTKIPGCPDKIVTHILPAGRMTGGPLGWLRAASNIGRGREMAKQLFTSFAPSAVSVLVAIPRFLRCWVHSPIRYLPSSMNKMPFWAASTA
jgi:UDP-N-acetylglucosamine--N-acetylmuramyl-(pentapeptide) pyrophosphoryl-undecaprenol N-acetylglucosamine transferase